MTFEKVGNLQDQNKTWAYFLVTVKDLFLIKLWVQMKML